VYLVGSIPFGLVVGKLKGVDLRAHGSRNIGATNAGRVLGRKFGVLVFLLDLLKGAAPTFAAGAILQPYASAGTVSVPLMYGLWLAIGITCVIGHNYPVYLGFRGGKGVSTSLGVALGIYPDLTLAGLAAFVVWLIVVGICRYVSLASVLAALVLPVALVVFTRLDAQRSLSDRWPLVVFALLLAILIIWRHRENLARLVKGTEAKVGQGSHSPS
jgi:glycerol-3-phosphate acyltransferase PlsY